MSYIFGPVPSRRLGRSLGVDVVPLKTCTYDCIYCQLGRTTYKTIERREWVPLGDVLAELSEKLSLKPDYITLSGSGEPTLYSRLGELINQIKTMTQIPVAVLTNGSLLWQEEVRRDLQAADLVVPSLDAGDEQAFRRVNRPHESISFHKMLQGLISFRKEYPGQYWLEVFVLAGETDFDAEIAKLVKCVEAIKPDRVQLNTVTRPPAERSAVGLTHEHMNRIAPLFNPPAEVIADFQGVYEQSEFVAGRTEILNMLRRRPCNVDDIANGLGLHRNEVIKYINELTTDNQVQSTWTAGKLYYAAKSQDK